MYFKITMYYHNLAVKHDNKYWLVVLTILKDITVVTGKDYPMTNKIHVPNHQPAM